MVRGHINGEPSECRALPRNVFFAFGSAASVLFMLLLSGCSAFQSGDHTDKNNYALKITPAASVVTVGHTIHLSATSPWGDSARWSVLPASLGTIDQNGNFTASNTPDSGTIIAMWDRDIRYTATATTTVVAVPQASITVVAPVGNVSGTASVSTQPDSTYVWTIQGGTILSGQGTPQIRFTDSGTGATQVNCGVTDGAGDTTNNSATVPPTIGYDPTIYTLIRGADIGRINPTRADANALMWQVSPDLPLGLAFNASTGVISGTPASPTPAATYTVTASNTGGLSNAAPLTITVIDSAPIFSYVPNAYVWTVNSPITPISPTLTHGTVTLWRISPAVPAGLVFDSATGQISGASTVLSPNTSYTVTASNNWGSVTAEPLFINVVDVPPAIHYAPSTFTFTRGTTLSPIVPTNFGGRGTSWSIAPPLTAGLSFNTATGSISGNPSMIAPVVSYSVTATNSGGMSAPDSFNVTVVDIVPTIQYPSATLAITINSALAPFSPTNSGGPATSWNILPALPYGLSFDPATGTLSGTPDTAIPPVLYSVTATNTGGSSQPVTITNGHCCSADFLDQRIFDWSASGSNSRPDADFCQRSLGLGGVNSRRQRHFQFPHNRNINSDCGHND